MVELKMEDLSPQLKIQWIALKKKEERTKEEKRLLLAVRVCNALGAPSLEILLATIQDILTKRKENREYFLPGR